MQVLPVSTPNRPVDAAAFATVRHQALSDQAATDKTVIDPLCPTIFHEYWWLDAAAPDAWAETKAIAKGAVVGRLPYFTQAGRIGGAALYMPLLCHFLGPAIDDGNGAAANRALRRDKIIRDLLDALPPHGMFSQRVHRGLSDVMVFAEAGFRTHAQFTFEIAPDAPDQLWAAMRDKTRNTIRRAQEVHDLTDTLGPEDFARFYVQHANASSGNCYYSAEAIARVSRAAILRDQGRIFAALTPDGTVAAAIFCVWDATCCYYLLSMRDRRADNGAISQLIWQAICHASARGLVFDFDGLQTRGSRVFFTGFGGSRQPRYQVTRETVSHRFARRAGMVWAQTQAMVRRNAYLAE